MQQKTAPKTERELEAEQAKQAAEAAKNAPSPPPRPTQATPGGEKLVALGPDGMLGPKSATKEVTIGWEWTPEIQGDPGKFYESIEQISKAAPGVRIRVVNRDANPNVPLGVSQAGKILVPSSPEGALPPDIGRTVQAITGGTAPPPGPAATP